MIRALLKFIAAGCIALLTASCSSDVDATVKVGAISTAASARGLLSGRSAPEDAVQSTTQFAFAKVDGIKLNLNSLQTVNGTSNNDIVSWSPAKEVIIAPGSDNTLAISETASIAPGSYAGIKVRYKNSYSVKAYCRTATKFVYTSATGVKTADVATVTGTLPTDYDYYAYPFAEITTATSATAGTDEAQAETHSNFTVTEASSLSIAILFDPSYLVTCFDGSTAVSSGNGLSPFVWTNNNGLSTTDFFPDNTPNFGMGYVPIFIWVSTNPSETVPTAETYASSTTLSNINGSTLDYKALSITSFAFKSDGTLLDGRTRTNSSGSSSDLQQFYSDFGVSGSTFSFKNGEWTCNSDYSSCRPIQDRSITGFTRTSDFTSTSSSTIDNASDCGTTITFPEHPEWGNQARACLSSSAPLYWRQLVR